MQLGASGVQMATRFVTTYECDASLEFKQSYIDAKKEDLVIIKSPVGMPGRAIINQFLKNVEIGLKKPLKCPYHCISTCDQNTSPYCIILELMNAKKGYLKNGFAFAGANAYLADKIISVKELIGTLEQGYTAAELAFKKKLNLA